MHMKKAIPLAAAVGLLFAAGYIAPANAQTATYRATFEGKWTTAVTPGGVPSGAHFTTLIGAVHNNQATFWSSGGRATAGIELMAELGGTSTFSSEIRAAGANARATLSRSVASGPRPSATFEFTVTPDHPLVTLTSMVAPSPDWFVGISGLSLRDSDGWVDSMTVDLFPYDAGTEDGTEFSLSNPATSPQGTIASLKGTGKFTDQPIATLTFTLISESSLPEVSVNVVRGERAVVRGGVLVQTEEAARFGAPPTQFRILVDSAPSSDLTVCLSVSESGVDRVASSAEGSKTVTISGGSEFANYPAISWTHDSVDNRNSLVTLSAVAPSDSSCSQTGYTVSSDDGSGSFLIEDDDATPLSLSSEDTVMVEGDASQTAEAVVRLGRRMYAGEVLAYGLRLSTTTGARLPDGDAMTPDDFAVSVSGDGVTASGLGGASPTLVFTGSDTDTVRDATLTFTPTAGSSDGDATDDAVRVGFGQPDTATNVGGGGRGTGGVDLTLSEPPPSVSISGGAGVTEGGDAVFTLTASPAPASELSVRVSVADDSASDFLASGQEGTRTVTVPTGGTMSFTVSTTGDGADEADGEVTATVTAGSGYAVGSPSSATVAVSDDDVPSVSISGGAGVTEGGDAVFTLTASPAPASALSVTVSVADDSASDFLASGQEGTRTVTVPTGGTMSFTVSTTGDGADEADGEVTATVTAGNGYAVGSPSSATVAVSDDDVPSVSISGGAGVTEGGGAVFTLTASPAPASALSVTVSVADDSASDFLASGQEGTRTVTVPTGGTMSFTVSTTGDGADEADGEVTATVTAGSGYAVGSPSSATVSVSDDDVPSVSISGGAGVTEGGGAVFTLTASPAPASALSVTVSVADDSASDFLASGQEGTRTVTVPTGGTMSFTVSTTGDGADEADGEVTATVTAGSGYAVGSPSSATVTVSDDDGAALPQVTIAVVTASPVSEGGSITFRLTASPAPASALSVRVSVADDSASDFLASGQEGARTVTVPSSGTADFTVSTTGDGADEADGEVTATVTAGSGYTVDRPSSATVAVSDDDEAALPQVTIAAVTASPVSEGGSITFRLTASPAPASALSVRVSVADDSASDFLASGQEGARTVTVPSSGTTDFTVSTTGDGADEADGEVTATVTAGSGYAVGSPSSATVAVSDDDVPSLAVSESSLSLEEYFGSASYTVALGAAPRGAVAVAIAVSESAGVRVSPASLSFTADNWNMPQTVTVDVVEDDDIDDESGALIHAASGGGYDGVSAEVAVMVDDGDEPSLVASESSLSLEEGASASYTVALEAAPSGAVTVAVSVSDGAGVEVSPTSLSFTAATWNMPQSVTVTALEDDDIDDESGALIHAASGGGYDGVSAEVAVMVDDGDEPSLVASESSLSLEEGASASYTVALEAAPSGAVTVAVSVSDGAGVEVSPTSLSFTAATWNMPQSVTVTALEDDDIDDESGSLIHAASGGGYDGVSAEVAVMVDDDDEPSVAAGAGAWMPRFGRVASEQIIEGIGDRVASRRSRAAMRPENAGNGDVGASFEAVFAGRGLGAYGSFLGGSPGGGFADGERGMFAGGAGAGGNHASRGFPVLDADGGSAGGGPLGSVVPLAASGPSGTLGPATGRGARGDRSLGSLLRGALANSSFNAGGSTASGADWGLWGRGSVVALEGRSAMGAAVDGDVTTGQVGADWSAGRWLLGLSASYSRGDGDYADAAGGGSMESSMAALTPYAGVEAGRFSAWGAFGAGWGDMTLAPERGAAVKADIDMRLGAAGFRGELMDFGDGFSLSLVSDAMAARSASDAADGLPEAEAEASRLRAAVEASWTRSLADGTRFSARLEGGVRMDGGAAEDGLGGEVSAGLSWLRCGLAVEIEGRRLVAHEDDDFAQTGVSAHLGWEACGAGGLGPSVSLRQRWGIATASGLEQLFDMRRMGRFGLEQAARRLDAEFGWGLPLSGGRFLGTPFALHGAQGGGGSLQALGWRMEPLGADGGAMDASMVFKLVRRDDGIVGRNDHGILLEARLGF